MLQFHSDSQISKPQIPNRSDQRIRERFQWVSLALPEVVVWGNKLFSTRKVKALASRA